MAVGPTPPGPAARVGRFRPSEPGRRGAAPGLGETGSHPAVPMAPALRPLPHALQEQSNLGMHKADARFFTALGCDGSPRRRSPLLSPPRTRCREIDEAPGGAGRACVIRPGRDVRCSRSLPQMPDPAGPA